MKTTLLGINKKPLAIAIFSFLVLAFFYLLYLPADHFDEGESKCLSVMLLDKECYGCGMTRGVQHLLHADFDGAWHFNKLSFIVLPLAVYMISTSLYKMAKEGEEKK